MKKERNIIVRMKDEMYENLLNITESKLSILLRTILIKYCEYYENIERKRDEEYGR